MWVTPKEGLKYQHLFEGANVKYGVPTQLMSRLAFEESSYDEKAHNKGSNACGLMQVVPRWHPTLSDPFDPEQAVPYAAKYLTELRKQFKTWDKTLAAYNWGPNNVKKAIAAHGDDWLNHAPKETYNYVVDVCKDTGITG